MDKEEVGEPDLSPRPRPSISTRGSGLGHLLWRASTAACLSTLVPQMPQENKETSVGNGAPQVYKLSPGPRHAEALDSAPHRALIFVLSLSSVH